MSISLSLSPLSSYIHKSWLPLFNEYDFNLDEFYKNEKDEGTNIYPSKELVFRAYSSQ